MAEFPGSIPATIRLQPDARTKAALVALGWTPPAGADTERDLWHLLVHIPQGLAGEIPGFLNALGCETYRMWDTSEERRRAQEAKGTSR